MSRYGRMCQASHGRGPRRRSTTLPPPRPLYAFRWPLKPRDRSTRVVYYGPEFEGYVSRESFTSMLRAVLIALTVGAVPWNHASAQDVPLFIAHAAVIDVIAGRARPDMTVEIRGRTIAAVSEARHVRIP